MNTETYEQTIELPETVSVQAQEGKIILTGPKGSAERKTAMRNLNVDIKGNEVTLSSKNATKEQKKMINTLIAHMGNMIKGVTEGHVYKLKICYSHFPINAAVTGDQLAIKNFIGEKVPRTTKIVPGTKVIISGAEISVESISKELAGQMAANIEQLTRRTDFDRRKFQDGIYIIIKDGQNIG